jgi:hypothetical protein
MVADLSAATAACGKPTGNKSTMQLAAGFEVEHLGYSSQHHRGAVTAQDMVAADEACEAFNVPRCSAAAQGQFSPEYGQHAVLLSMDCCAATELRWWCCGASLLVALCVQ